MAGVPGTRQLSYGAVAAGIGGIVLVVALFLPWADLGFDESANAFNLADIVDIVLLLIGLAAVGFAALEFTGNRVNTRFSLPRALQVIGIVATTLTWYFIIEQGASAFGVILAGLASIAILVGGVLAEKRPNLSMTIGGGQRAGGGYGAPPPQAGPGGYGPPPGGGFAQPPAGPGAEATAAQPLPPPQAPPAPAGSPPPPPGGTPDWYPDPRGEKRLRYFDGNQWTEHVAD